MSVLLSIIWSCTAGHNRRRHARQPTGRPLNKAEMTSCAGGRRCVMITVAAAAAAAERSSPVIRRRRTSAVTASTTTDPPSLTSPAILHRHRTRRVTMLNENPVSADGRTDRRRTCTLSVRPYACRCNCNFLHAPRGLYEVLSIGLLVTQRRPTQTIEPMSQQKVSGG